MFFFPNSTQHIFLFIIIFLASIPYLTAKEHTEKVVTLANGEWPPYQSQQLKHYGFASYLAEEAFKIEGIKVKYVFRPWKRAYEEAKNGMEDGTLIWRYTKKRAKYFYYSNPLVTSESVIFHLKSLPFDWKNNQQLVKYKIGGTLGYFYPFENIPNIHIERAKTDKLNFSKLLARRIQLFWNDKIVSYAILNKNFSKKEISKITYSKDPNHSDISYRLMLNKKNVRNKTLITLFNKGLKKLKESGRYKEIIQQELEGRFFPDSPKK